MLELNSCQFCLAPENQLCVLGSYNLFRKRSGADTVESSVAPTPYSSSFKKISSSSSSSVASVDFFSSRLPNRVLSNTGSLSFNPRFQFERPGFDFFSAQGISSNSSDSSPEANASPSSRVITIRSPSSTTRNSPKRSPT